MFRKIYINIGLLFLALSPVLVYADIGGAINKLITDLNRAPALLVGMGVIFFLWGVLKYVNAGGEGDVKEATQLILWGLVAIFVMVSVWGLVRLIGSTLTITPGGSKIDAPQI